jgi:hypothetical protein
VLKVLTVPNIQNWSEINGLFKQKNMKAKLEKGQKVRVTQRNGKTIDGIIRDWDYNCCTFEVQYNVDYIKSGNVWTMICVPENSIELI